MKTGSTVLNEGKISQSGYLMSETGFKHKKNNNGKTVDYTTPQPPSASPSFVNVPSEGALPPQHFFPSLHALTSWQRYYYRAIVHLHRHVLPPKYRVPAPTPPPPPLQAIFLESCARRPLEIPFFAKENEFKIVWYKNENKLLV